MEPPHMRGKVACADQTIQPDGITPAWAGKSPSCPTHSAARRDHPRMGGKSMTAPGRSSQTGDHPRVGGEKITDPFDLRLYRGSPPRGRGKALLLLDAGVVVGITPAWAGKSEATASTTTSRRDHPRVGGEKTAFTSESEFSAGSPPRGRGKGTGR